MSEREAVSLKLTLLLNSVCNEDCAFLSPTLAASFLALQFSSIAGFRPGEEGRALQTAHFPTSVLPGLQRHGFRCLNVTRTKKALRELKLIF